MVGHRLGLGMQHRVVNKVLALRPIVRRRWTTFADRDLPWMHVGTDVVDRSCAVGGRGHGRQILDIAEHDLACAQSVEHCGMFMAIGQRPDSLITPDEGSDQRLTGLAGGAGDEEHGGTVPDSVGCPVWVGGTRQYLLGKLLDGCSLFIYSHLHTCK